MKKIHLFISVVAIILLFAGCVHFFESNSTDSSEVSTPEQTEKEVIDDSTFEVHFIDVGQADASLIICDGHAMLIDGGNVEDSSLIYSYLKSQNITQLDYIVCTHAHEDHVGGLSGALNIATAEVAFAPVASYDSESFNDFVTYLSRQNISITVPTHGDKFMLGSASCQIVGPIYSSDEPNNTSLVIRVIYGDTSFLFAGDAERDAEQDILSAGYDLSSTVLKVGHHGSETSTSYTWLREVNPNYAIISVGKDNAYGHPDEVVLSRLRDADVVTYRTDIQGDIICVSDGTNVYFTVEKAQNADTLADAGAGRNQVVVTPQENADNSAIDISETYICNTNTKKFHYPSCSSVDSMSEKNKKIVDSTREELISQGYDPCGRCHP